MVNIFKLQSYKCYHGDPIKTRGLSVDNPKHHHRKFSMAMNNNYH